MHLYKIILTQKLSKKNDVTCRACPHAGVVLFSEKAHFYLRGAVHKKNFRYWAENNPCELHERLFHCPRVTVWCAVVEFGIWGLYFFEEEYVLVIVNFDQYSEMLETFLISKLNIYHEIDNF